MRINFVTLILCITGLTRMVSGSSGADLEQAFDIVFSPTFDHSAVFEVFDLTITHQDMNLYFDSGRIYVFQPVEIDGTPHRFGAYFSGKGSFKFAPSLRLEKDQMQRFFKSDSLNRSIESAELLFSDQIYQLILDSCKQQSPSPIPGWVKKGFKKAHNQLTHHEQRSNIFRTLKCLTEPTIEPFLLVNVEPDGTNRVCYRYDPYNSEEVCFFKTWGLVHHKSWFEMICSYSPTEKAQPYGNNISRRSQLGPIHYKITTTIDDRGECFCETELSCEVRAALQIVHLKLHYKLEVDSVLDSSGRSLRFKRWKKKDNSSSGLYLFFEEKLIIGTDITLTFFYHGKIAERFVGEFFVQAGASWYPRVDYNQETTFEMLFRTPKHFGFTAVGRLIDSTVVKDTMITHWHMDEPVPNVSFNIGNFKTHKLTKKDILPEGVEFTNQRHQDMLDGMTIHTVAKNRNMEKHVGRDVMGSLQLFEHYFGQLPTDKLVISEILAFHSTAYPGHVQMSFGTFLESDYEGYERQHRSHEVAHQWWGIGVDHKTYHDQWLSEGFAEYSGMLYVEVTSGHEKFMQMLKEYRERVFSARKYLLSSGAESGPIIMGYRTSSTETPGDYGLVIYKKSALVLHMLRNLLMDLGNFSDERFFAMMKDWYLTYRGQQMTTKDFKEHCDKHFGIDMTWFFDQWVYGNDLPTYRFSYECNRDTKGLFSCQCKVQTTNVDSTFQMYVPIEIKMKNMQTYYTRQLIAGPTTVFEISGLESKPKKLKLNPFESILAKVKQ